MDDHRPGGAEWRHIYHDRLWTSLLVDAAGFIIAVLAALIGLATMYFRIASLTGGTRAEPVNITRVWWLDDAIILAIATVFAWWGLRAMWQALIDVIRPALIDEGRVERVGIHMVSGSHGGYREWTMSFGSKSWSMAYLQGRPNIDMIEPGMTVRVRYRPGSWSIADLWMLREDAPQAARSGPRASRSAP